jgi:hypothetical protein
MRLEFKIIQYNGYQRPWFLFYVKVVKSLCEECVGAFIHLDLFIPFVFHHISKITLQTRACRMCT